MKQGFTDALIKNLTQPGRYTDAQTRGLNLQVKKGGGRYRTYRYSHDGRRVSLAYRDGVLCEKDPVKSSRYCEIAAKAGYPEAQGQLGLNYWYGAGVEKDVDLAFKWVSMCAFQGESRGLYLLGLMYDQGIGCEQDYAEAIRLYRDSARPHPSGGEVSDLV